jgi:hypothetical protein
VVLVVEGAGIGEIIDPAKHLDADTPVLGEIVFGAPAIFETEAVGLAVIADLRRKKRVECQQELAGAELDDRTELDLVCFAPARGKAIATEKRQTDAFVVLDLDQFVDQL